MNHQVEDHADVADARAGGPGAPRGEAGDAGGLAGGQRFDRRIEAFDMTYLQHRAVDGGGFNHLPAFTFRRGEGFLHQAVHAFFEQRQRGWEMRGRRHGDDRRIDAA